MWQCSGPAQWVAEVLSFLFDEQLFRARRVHAIKWLFELTPMLTKIDNNNDGDDNCNYKYDDDGDNDKMQRTKPDVSGIVYLQRSKII